MLTSTMPFLTMWSLTSYTRSSYLPLLAPVRRSKDLEICWLTTWSLGSSLTRDLSQEHTGSEWAAAYFRTAQALQPALVDLDRHPT